jgi:hypothetical protein
VDKNKMDMFDVDYWQYKFVVVFNPQGFQDSFLLGCCKLDLTGWPTSLLENHPVFPPVSVFNS